MFNQPYELQWETVAVPLVDGLDLNTRARLVKPPTLLRALNVRFPREGGPEKRHGHRSRPARSVNPFPTGVAAEVTSEPSAPDPYNPDRAQPENWLFGYGLFDPTTPTEVSFPAGYVAGDPAAAVGSAHPYAGALFGALARDDEAAVWDGFRLYPYVAGREDGATRPVTAVVPWARVSPIARNGAAQSQPTGGDNGTIRVVAWMAGTSAMAQTFDSVTGAAMTGADRLGSGTNVKVVPVGDWVHVYVFNTGASQIDLYARRVDSNGWKHAVVGACNGNWDLRTLASRQVLLARSLTSSSVEANYVSDDAIVGSAITIPLGTMTVTAGLGLAVHERTGNFILVLGEVANVYARVYTPIGTAYAGEVTVAGDTPVAVTAADLWLDTLADPGTPRFRVYWESSNGGIPFVGAQTLAGDSPEGTTQKRYELGLGAQAFRTGNRTHVIGYHSSTYQSTWFLLDDQLLPVGRWTVGTAYRTASTWLPPVNWRGTAAAKDRVVFHLALGAKTRIQQPATASGVPAPVFTEPYPVWVDLDFMPPLRSAQAGRTTYIPGAQVWGYDGASVHEAGFPLYPETVSAVGSNGAGALTALGKYTYRVDLCHKNRAGEEVRSASIFFYTDGHTAPFALAATHDTVTLTGRTIPTRHTDSYVLIWRNESEGTLWYLINSRDPASADYIPNDTSTGTWTFTDLVSDTSLLAGRELHPAQAANYINPFPAPACEVIAAGRDRVWVAGGEIAPGVVSPSRLFSPGERASFSPVLEVQVDRAGDPVTAVGHIGDITAVFRRSAISALDSDGPDNNFQGGWTPARPIVTDTGAVSQESLARTTAGLLFQAPGGIRMLGPSGQVNPVGIRVDPLGAALNVAAAVVNPEDLEVRFYGRTGSTLVVSYQSGQWSEWSTTCYGAVRTPALGVVLARARGQVWTESDEETTDGGRGFEYLIRSGWFGGSVVDFIRIRRVAMFGEFLGHHRATVRFFYNDRDWPEEEFSWTTSDDLVNGAWGDGDWGSGMWGDPTDTDRDSVWRWRRRCARQKCSSFSVEITDNAATTGGFIPTVLALEVGRRGGLDRLPARTFGD